MHAISKGLQQRLLAWLNVLPLYTPTTEPIISGMMSMLRRCVRTGSGFSPAGVQLTIDQNLMNTATTVALQLQSVQPCPEPLLHIPVSASTPSSHEYAAGVAEAPVPRAT